MLNAFDLSASVLIGRQSYITLNKFYDCNEISICVYFTPTRSSFFFTFCILPILRGHCVLLSCMATYVTLK